MGRSTGITQGGISGLASAILETVSDYGQTVTVPTFETSIVPKDCALFSCGGDSGALVYVDSSTKVVGMVFASDVGRGVSYMTPLPDLFADIKRVTGARDVRIAGGGRR